MKKETFDTLLETIKDDYAAVVKAVAVKPKKDETKYKSELTPLEEYQVENHPIFDKAKRPDKIVKIGGMDVPKPVTRIGLSFEQMIAGRAAAFLCANPVQYHAQPETDTEVRLFEAFKRVNENAKLDFKNLAILETRMSETEVAEIWYLDDTEEDDDYWGDVIPNAKKKPRLFQAQPSLGDTLYPVWNGQDNLMAIGRGYKETTEDGKEIEHFDLYTAETIYEGVKEGSGWTVTDVPNELKKIPVVYHAQPDVEWAKVRSIIRRLEEIHSNFGDSNDRTAFPILLLKGKPTALPQGVGDKALQMDDKADASYLVPNNAPEAIKIEVDGLLRQLYALSDTPDLSFDNLKGLASPSGFALLFMFMGAHLKAARHAGTYGECLQRRINLIKRMIVTIDPSLKEAVGLTIKPTFDFFLPKDWEGTVNWMTTAVTGKILSKETAVTQLQGMMGGDGKQEYERVQNEANGPDGLDSQFN